MGPGFYINGVVVGVRNNGPVVGYRPVIARSIQRRDIVFDDGVRTGDRIPGDGKPCTNIAQGKIGIGKMAARYAIVRL